MLVYCSFTGAMRDIAAFDAEWYSIEYYLNNSGKSCIDHKGMAHINDISHVEGQCYHFQQKTGSAH